MYRRRLITFSGGMFETNDYGDSEDDVPGLLENDEADEGASDDE